MTKEVWTVCGSNELRGAVITYVDYDGAVNAEKDGTRYRTEITQDWGYCYCFDYSDDGGRCTCTPTMTVITEKC